VVLGEKGGLTLLTDGVLACASGAGETFDFRPRVRTVETAGRTVGLLIPPMVRARGAFTTEGQRQEGLILVQAAWR
jgi:hypothetical protein